VYLEVTTYSEIFIKEETHYAGLISFEISKNRYGNFKVKSAAISKLMTFAVELRAPQHQNGEQEEGDTIPEGA
jgi:hypothetical protein